MAPCRLYIIGIHVLVLCHMAQSFVLLTANMEDVKKIARRFVSESLADKIADFISKAANQKDHQVSLENDKASDEFNIKQKTTEIGRQRFTKTTRTPKDFSLKKVYKPKPARAPQKELPKGRPKPGQNINWEKERNEISYEKYSKEAKEKPITNKKQKIYYKQPKTDYQQQNLRPEIENEQQKVNYEPKLDYEQLKQKRQRKIRPHAPNPNMKESRPSVDARDESAQPIRTKLKPQHPRQNIKPIKQLSEESGNRPISPPAQKKKRRLKPSHRQSGFNAKVVLDPAKSAYNIQDSLNPAPPDFKVQTSFTTEKEKNEFDQYDNPNYPKRGEETEFIATSGPVALPRVVMKQPWWDKELSNSPK